MEDKIWKAIEKVVQLDRESDEREAIWLRQVLVLAAGALAVLAALGPAAPPGGAAQALLAATWGLLGLGIASGAAATYMAVDHAKRVAKRYRKHIVDSIDRIEEFEGRIEHSGDFRESTDAIEESSDIEEEISDGPGLDTVPRSVVLVACKPVMLLSLLAAVLCLAAYAITTTLAV